MGKKTEPQGGIASCTENQRRKRETYLGRTIRQTGIEARYDQAAKALLASREVLAMILQGVVREYEGCTLKQIEDCIEGEPVIGREAVHRGDPGRIRGLPGEDGSLLEGTVYYDVLFQARVPGIGEEAEPIRLIINLEAQSRDDPGYPLLNRAVYYGSRLLSAQYGRDHCQGDYGKLRKVYSIWICMKPRKGYQNSIWRYGLRGERLAGEAGSGERPGDLLNVIMINLGNEETGSGLLRFLEVLFSDETGAEQKKEIIEQEYGLEMSRETEGRVEHMCNLSQGVLEKGYGKGNGCWPYGRRDEESQRDGLFLGGDGHPCRKDRPSG